MKHSKSLIQALSIFCVAVLSFGVVGCNEKSLAADTSKAATSTNLDQGESLATVLEKLNAPTGFICTITNPFEVGTKCRNGDTIAFLPESWGNAQYPLYAAKFCNLEKSVVMNESGLICEYQPKAELKNISDENVYALNLQKTEQVLKQVQKIPNIIKLPNDHGMFSNLGAYYEYLEHGTGSSIAIGDIITIESQILHAPGTTISESFEVKDDLFYVDLYLNLKEGDEIRGYFSFTKDCLEFLQKKDQLGLPILVDIKILKVEKAKEGEDKSSQTKDRQA